MSSDSEDELGFNDDASDPEPEVDEDILGQLEQDLDQQPSEQEEDSDTEDSDSGGDDDDDEDDEEPPPPMQVEQHALVDTSMAIPNSPSNGVQYNLPPSPRDTSSRGASPQIKAPTPPIQTRPPSPAGLRKLDILKSITHWPRSFTVEAICAIPHPSPTHSLAASLCLTHLLTGSDDGYIRDYDIFSGLNGKVLLSAPQRHHCGVMEGVIKAAQFRYWWENPADLRNFGGGGPGAGVGGLGAADDVPLCAPYSMLMHSDALWSLAGTDQGHINLFTVRHQPGTLIHTLYGHRGPVSAMAMRHDEKGFYSAGWDGEAHEWDLNTGQIVRNYTAHPSQLVAVAVRPVEGDYTGIVPWVGQPRVNVVPSASWDQSRSHSQSQPQSQYPSQFQPPEDVKMYTMDASEEPADPAVKQELQAPPPPQQIPSDVPSQQQQQQQEDDAKSDTSFDPLFDEAEGDMADDSALGFPPPSNPSQPTQSQYQTQSHTHPGPPPITTQLSMPGPGLPSARLPPAPVAPAPAPKNAPPILDAASYAAFSPDVLLTASIDGQVMLWDRRAHSSSSSSSSSSVGRLWMSEKTPPWCVSACWSADGSQVYAGRRNGTVDVWDVRMGVVGSSGASDGMGVGMEGMRTPRVLKVIRNPPSSGVVSYVCAFPDGRHIACASTDNIRLWNVAEAGEPDAVSGRMKSGVQFKIIPGHHGGTISQLLVDRQGRFLISASSNRGWFGESSRTVFVHDIKKNW